MVIRIADQTIRVTLCISKPMVLSRNEPCQRQPKPTKFLFQTQMKAKVSVNMVFIPITLLIVRIKQFKHLGTLKTITGKRCTHFLRQTKLAGLFRARNTSNCVPKTKTSSIYYLPILVKPTKILQLMRIIPASNISISLAKLTIIKIP